ncbi:hypothetical protein A9G28_06090 [Gilliamella sp. Fer1-1]|uniref:hypothetical protein n=1 Tax=Gilliamella sp. Fer1-1 TaxID=3120240 RepID=UPI00080D9DC0|nr:hypothetical protein [Gilliamella apicola]OCG41357.1 hypothetical protein A9G28_06090 [Gilliamella apicola]
MQQVKKLYGFVITKEKNFTLYYDPQSGYGEESDPESNYNKFGCNTLISNDVLTTLQLSFYYGDDERFNKAMEYFERACAIKSSGACNL